MKKNIWRLLSVKKISLLLQSLLPERISHHLVRRTINLDYNLPEGLVFKVAETQQEREQAFEILQEAFLERKLVNENGTGIRVTKYHALPTTTVLIIKDRDVVIGTISVITDSPLLLPADELSDISYIRKSHKRIVEISAFAIKNGLKYTRSYLMFPMMRFMCEYTHKYLHADCMVIATHPRMKAFYAGILGFKPVDKKVYTYEFVQGAKAYTQYANFESISNWQEKVYKGKKPQKNYYTYSQFDFSKNFVFPERTYYKAFDAIMSPAVLDYFFNDKSDVFSDLSLHERKKIKDLYFFKYFNAIIDKAEKTFERKYPRFPTSCPATISSVKELSLNTLSIEPSHSGTVTQVGERGIGIHSDKKLTLDKPLYFDIQLGPEIKAKIKARPIWTDHNGQYGCELIYNKSAKVWSGFISYLENNYCELDKKSA